MLKSIIYGFSIFAIIYMLFTPVLAEDVEISDIVCFYVTVPDPPDIIEFDLPPGKGFVLKEAFVGYDGDHITFYENGIPKTMINTSTSIWRTGLGIPFKRGSAIGIGAWTRSQNLTIIGYTYSNPVELSDVYSFYVTVPVTPGTVDIQLNEGTGFVLKEVFTGRGGDKITITENGTVKTEIRPSSSLWESAVGIPFERGCTITLSAEMEETNVTFVGYKY